MFYLNLPQHKHACKPQSISGNDGDENDGGTGETVTLRLDGETLDVK